MVRAALCDAVRIRGVVAAHRSRSGAQCAAAPQTNGSVPSAVPAGGDRPRRVTVPSSGTFDVSTLSLGSTIPLSLRHSNFSERTMTPDPAIDAIRRVRRQISNDVDNDAARLIDHYKQMQTTFAGRVIHGPESAPEQPGTLRDGSASTVGERSTD